MAFRSGARRERSRRRRQLLGRLVMVTLAGAVLVGLGYASYQTGTELSRAHVRELERTVNALSDQLETIRAEAARSRIDLTAAQQAMATLQKRYDADVPAGDLATIHSAIRQKLGQGLPAARLLQVVQDATPVRACEGRVTRRRFAIQQAGKGADETAALLDGLINVTASLPAGTSDAARGTVTLVRTAWTDDPLKLSGLPAKQDIVVNNLVLHLAVEPSDLAGYAAVTLSLCGKG
jgi:hypothetical protein